MFNPWVRKILWRRAWQPTPVFLPGESHGQRSLAGHSSWACKNETQLEWLSTHIYLHSILSIGSYQICAFLGFFFFILCLCILLPMFLKIRFNFMQSNSSVIYFMKCTFDIVAKKSLFNSGHRDFLHTKWWWWNGETELFYTTCGNDNCYNLFWKYFGSI